MSVDEEINKLKLESIKNPALNPYKDLSLMSKFNQTSFDFNDIMMPTAELRERENYNKKLMMKY